MKENIDSFKMFIVNKIITFDYAKTYYWLASVIL